MQSLFYQPRDGVAADFIPFYEDGTFYLFYLKDYRNPETYGEGTPWFLVTTRDFVCFDEHGEVLPRGTREEQDLYVFTGSVTKIDDTYHLYYTGHNPYFRKQGKPEQAVMHAVSGDLIHWEKRPQNAFYAPTDCYEAHDWRDPFLYRDVENGEYWMLLAARTKTGAPRRRGITALMASDDGVNWRKREPFWAPGLYFTHECPDMFRMGDWYYLIFSEFSQEKVTRYRMSRSRFGPWIASADDRLDTCAYYAAKSCGDEKKRHLFGWLATREKESDEGAWQWGGCLVVHEIIQNADGTLSIRIPECVENAFIRPDTPVMATLHGKNHMVCQTMGDVSGQAMLDVDITIDSPIGQAGIALYADEMLDSGYFLRLELNRARIVFDRWPRPGDQAFESGLERPIRLMEGGAYHLKVVLDGTAACAYLNGETALSFRMYNTHNSFWGIQSENADSRFLVKMLRPVRSKEQGKSVPGARREDDKPLAKAACREVLAAGISCTSWLALRWHP